MFDSIHLLRGGSWSIRGCRSAFRDGGLPDDRFSLRGFRVCCLPQEAQQTKAAPMNPIYSLDTRNGEYAGIEADFYDGRPKSQSNMQATLTIHSNWQGSEDGAVYRADVPVEVVCAIKRELASEDHGLEPDAETAIRDWIKRVSRLIEESASHDGCIACGPSVNIVKIRTGSTVR